MSGTLDVSAAGLVVGATDPDAVIAFLGAFGLAEVARHAVDADTASGLYGLDRATTEVELGTDGTDHSRVWVVDCDEPGNAPADFERRPRAFDIYTSSMDDALEHLRFTGLAHGPVGTLAVGPVTMRQCLVTGPDGLAVVLVESTHRRGSLLDADDGRLFSEGHSVVWSVDSMDDEAALLSGVGLTKGMDLAFTEPEVSTYLDLPRSPVPIRMTMLSGEAVDPLRLELLEFSEDPGESVASDHLAGGLWALRYRVADPSAVAESLAHAGCSVEAAGAAMAATTPGGIRIQLSA
ncbi:MAG: hypothetical protein GY812_08975 [Actinomycetia bacterium]|nr:hypothetical protein [Actinomycetes bacterium]